MNPWDILTWIGAVCASLVVIAVTLVIIVSLAQSSIPKKATRVMRGERRE